MNRSLIRCMIIVPLLMTIDHFAREVAVFSDEPTTFADLDAEFVRDVHPLLGTYCLGCHAKDQLQGDLDLERFASLADVRTDPKIWQKIAEQLDLGEMPPADADQPTELQHRMLREWITRYLRAEALANAGDPGPVVLRRLNNAEYTYTIRDLTGVEFDPAREFPTDSAAGEGFTNAGNALSMSPALLTKYYDAAREIADHAVLLPDGFRFSLQRSRSDWTNELLSRIREFYRQRIEVVELGLGESVGVMNLHGNCQLGQLGRLPYDKYIAATIAERESLRTGQKTIDAVAQERGLNAKYLQLLWSALNDTSPSPLLDDLRERWKLASENDVAALVQRVAEWQRGLWTFNPISLRGRMGSRPLWQEPVEPLVTTQEFRLKIPAPADGDTSTETVISIAIGDAGDGNDRDFVVLRQPRFIAEGEPDILLRDIESLQGVERDAFGRHPNGSEIDAASLCVQAPVVLTMNLPREIAAGREFVFQAMMHKETGLDGSVQIAVKLGEANLPSGLHPPTVTVTLSQVTVLYADHRNVTIEYPILIADESPRRDEFLAAFAEHRRLFPVSLCYPQVVPADEVLTLIQFHREDDHLIRLLLDDRQAEELDRMWNELRYISQEPFKLSAVLDSLIESMRNQYQEGAFDGLIEPYRENAAAFRQQLQENEGKQLDALMVFAAEAYRRPLSPNEFDDLHSLYRRLRADEDLPHEAAFRLTLARVLIAAPFLYRLEDVPEDAGVASVSNWELASRLSYFLWSSQPDRDLRNAAMDGTLSDSRTLSEQTRRMLNDDRIRRLAIEFAGQWLHIHEFDVVEMKSEEHYPEFLELRDVMYEETILFFTDMFHNDGSLLDLLAADHSFVNDRLAEFYGIDGVPGPEWRRIDGIQQFGRGGILGFSATLAKQSGASRTSPILRGNWISEVLLGEKLPRPPKDVPQLGDEVPDDLTERQLIERHSSDPACAKCHRRIDAFGFALEGFDAIGRRRVQNQAGLLIDTKTTLPDGSEVEGIGGLRDYLLKKRRDQFLRQFCRKLLGYALGREVQLSDEPLLDEIQDELAKNDYRFSVAVEKIVLSKQFRNIRSEE